MSFQALRRGVQVNIIADKGAQLEGKGKECLGRLAAAGAHVRIWGKHRGYNKLHAKFSVFDNKLGLAGSNNGSKGTCGVALHGLQPSVALIDVCVQCVLGLYPCFW
jgi:hypothetical protein